MPSYKIGFEISAEDGELTPERVREISNQLEELLNLIHLMGQQEKIEDGTA